MISSYSIWAFFDWQNHKTLWPIVTGGCCPKMATQPLTSSRLHPSPHQQQARPQSPDLIWMIKTFFFSTNFVPPPLTTTTTTTLVCQSCAPSPIDHHTEEITLIAGITSPHVGYTRGRGGGMLGMMCKSVSKVGGAGNTKSGPLYYLPGKICDLQPLRPL